jgi:hypothetical protein
LQHTDDSDFGAIVALKIIFEAPILIYLNLGSTSVPPPSLVTSTCARLLVLAVYGKFTGNDAPTLDHFRTSNLKS